MTDAATPTLTPADVTPRVLIASILAHAEEALNNHGRKNYVEKIDFVDIMLDIRKIASHALDKLDA